MLFVARWNHANCSAADSIPHKKDCWQGLRRLTHRTETYEQRWLIIMHSSLLLAALPLLHTLQDSCHNIQTVTELPESRADEVTITWSLQVKCSYTTNFCSWEQEGRVRSLPHISDKAREGHLNASSPPPHVPAHHKLVRQLCEACQTTSAFAAM